MVKQQSQTKMTKDWLANVEQEETELKTKVKRLEMYIANSAPSSIKELQVTKASIIDNLQINEILSFGKSHLHLVQCTELQ